MNTTDKTQQLCDALKQGALWGSLARFLDTINLIEELEQLAPILHGSNKADLAEYYKENLLRWPDPQLPAGFSEKYPLFSARLDTPGKIRILLRGAYYRDVPPEIMGDVFEEIIHRHEVEGERKIVYCNYRGTTRDRALRIVYHTQLPYWTLTELALNGMPNVGISTKEGLFLDWRTKEERLAAGETVYS